MEEGDAGIQQGKTDGQYLSGKSEVFQKLQSIRKLDLGTRMLLKSCDSKGHRSPSHALLTLHHL